MAIAKAEIRTNLKFIFFSDIILEEAGRGAKRAEACKV
jgi:hypothetical protein